MLTVTFLLATIVAIVQGQTDLPFESIGTEIISRFDDFLTKVNVYVVDILDIAAKVIKAVREFADEMQSSNGTSFDIGQFADNAKDAFNTSSATCISEEASNLKILLTNTSNNIEACYSNVSEKIGNLIPYTEDMVLYVIDGIQNITNAVNACIAENPLPLMVIGLPSCLGTVGKHAGDDYNVFVTELNTTITSIISIATEIKTTTKDCLSDTMSQFVSQLQNLLITYVECVIDL